MSGAPEDYAPAGGLIVPQPSTTRGVAAIISISPDGKNVIYVNGSNVIIRSVEDPSLATAYYEHTHPVKVAKFSPNGKWVASGDESGKVRVWAWNRADHLLKAEVAALGGPVEDLAWDFENKRIFAVGGGSSKAKFFAFDTGSNLGDVVPMAKKGLTCDLKPSRPFIGVCGGEDFQLQLYNGVPFKYGRAFSEHSNFVNCVRYAPDGSKFVSVASDKTAIVYDGKTGEVTGRLDPASQHSGSIYHLAFSPDSTQLVTASADKTLKYWDAATLACVKTVPVGSALGDMQLSVFWGLSAVVSLSLDGNLNIFPPGADAPALVVTGHQAPITTFAFDQSGTGKLFTGCSAGKLCQWAAAPGADDKFVAAALPGEHHGGKVVGVAVANGQLATVAWDDKLRIADADSGDVIGTVATGGQPRGLAASPERASLRVVITSSAIKVFIGATLASETAPGFAPTAVSFSPSGGKLAVGGDDAQVHLYTVDVAGNLTAGPVSPAVGGPISVLSFSPDGTLIATGDAVRDVRLYSAEDASVVKSGKWQNHTTRITGLAWHPNSSALVTVSIDRRICVWSPSSDIALKSIDLAHAAPLSCVGWQSETHFWTLSTDGIVKRWAASW